MKIKEFLVDPRFVDQQSSRGLEIVKTEAREIANQCRLRCAHSRRKEDGPYGEITSFNEIIQNGIKTRRRSGVTFPLDRKSREIIELKMRDWIKVR